MKDIPQSKKSKNIWIVLLKDLGDFALYFNKTDDCFCGFEVHKIRVKPASETNIKCKDGRVCHISKVERRVIATSEEFGRYAWHYPNISMVYEKYPQFKSFSQEIESRLNDALIPSPETHTRETVDKTTFLHTRQPTTHSNNKGTPQKLETINEN